MRKELKSWMGALGIVALAGCASTPRAGRAPASVAEASAADLAAAEASGRQCAEAILSIPEAWQESSPELKQAFITCLRNYVRIPTLNPPGAEEAGVRFLKSVLDTLGIENRALLTEGRHNLIASLYPTGDAKTAGPIILYHHVDVVPVIADQWTRPDLPFSGAIEPHPQRPKGEKYLWGRGALDMKSIGIFQLLSMAYLKRNQAELKRAVHLVAASDEERLGTGAKGILREIRPGGALSDLQGAVALLNEGGYGVVRKNTPIYLIAAEEKGGAWMRWKHPDPLALLKQLDQSLALFSDHYVTPFQKPPRCKLITFSTPGAQVNITPSRAALSFDCSEDPNAGEIDFRSVFGTPLVAESHAEIQYSRNGDQVEIGIELPSAGHGSLGGTSALQIAAVGLQHLGLIPVRDKDFSPPDFYAYYKTPATADFIQHLIPLYHVPSHAIDWLTSIGVLDQTALRLVGKMAYSERLFRTSCSWTGFKITSEGAEAMVDCRLIHPYFKKPEPKLQADAFIRDLRARAQDSRLQMDLINGWNFASSPIHGFAIDILEREVAKEQPQATVTAYIAPTGSDSVRFRAPQTSGADLPPIPSYGFFPVIVENGLTETIHGSDERFPLSQIEPACRIYRRAVEGLAASD